MNKTIAINWEFIDRRAGEMNLPTPISLACAIGVDRQLVSAWRKGQYMPTMSKLAMICNGLDCQPQDVLTFSEGQRGEPAS
jgi:DNA-binding Xre family transcriptional regulator